MQNILLGFALSLVLSASAWSAPEMKAHEKKISAAKEWSDISAHLKGKIPSNVVREFSKFARGIPFPASRRIKNNLVLTQNDGTKVSIAFKKGGAISLNGKDWKLLPLATVEEEVTRLALFLSGEKKVEAGLFGLVPAAQAGGAGAMGVAAAAYAGANAWKAEACGEDELGDDLANDCPLMAVGMKPVLVKVRKIEDPELFLPVSLKCPQENNGMLELVSKNIEGKADRIRITFNKKLSPVVVSAAFAERGKSFEDYIIVNLTKATDPDQIEFGKTVFKRNETLLKNVCNGPKKNKERYFASLASNRSDLAQVTQKGDEADQETSMEAL